MNFVWSFRNVGLVKVLSVRKRKRTKKGFGQNSLFPKARPKRGAFKIPIHATQ